jgi:hypothetical protein
MRCNRRHRQGQLVKPLQIVGNPPRPKVIVLPEIEDLADHSRDVAPGDRCGVLGRSASPVSPCAA